MRRWDGANVEAYHAPKISVNSMILWQFWPFDRSVNPARRAASFRP
jgi:hypothetical protein